MPEPPDHGLIRNAVGTTITAKIFTAKFAMMTYATAHGTAKPSDTPQPSPEMTSEKCVQFSCFLPNS
jgi:hypothetical protein